MKESARKFVGGDNLGWIPPLSIVHGGHQVATGAPKNIYELKKKNFLKQRCSDL